MEFTKTIRCTKEFLLQIAEDWEMQLIEVDKDQKIQKRLSAKTPAHPPLRQRVAPLPIDSGQTFAGIVALEKLYGSLQPSCLAAGITLLLVKAIGALNDYGLSTDLGSLWHMGIGEDHGYSIVLTQEIESLGVDAFSGTLFLANVPQVILGSGWWLANSLLTRLLLAQRCARFIVKRSGLRVSSPEGQQRRYFFLSLPYRYGVPLLILSAVLHWLLSQSFFVVQATGFVYDLTYKGRDQFVRDNTLDGSVIGYSTIAFIFSLAIILGLSISIVFLAVKPLPRREIEPCESYAESDRDSLIIQMPLVSSCSAAISAACHPGPGSQDTHLRLVQWGKMRSGKWSITDETPLQYSLDT
ncbi:hypothetical protein O1611_g5014 [Lasiodiplodia mahajangana]|uniref:Uncharacterized protein n=1 Tax=Lasiodiplodia mahajangana TaxID=1108764 RepID=A0ACC2JMQ5_9PEZI|nr:hypothetical protein O1611_g5014 [Lasiodiplodia mahajangana]